MAGKRRSVTVGAANDRQRIDVECCNMHRHLRYSTGMAIASVLLRPVMPDDRGSKLSRVYCEPGATLTGRRRQLNKPCQCQIARPLIKLLPCRSTQVKKDAADKDDAPADEAAWTRGLGGARHLHRECYLHVCQLTNSVATGISLVALRWR
jgi:hypothetical protein